MALLGELALAHDGPSIGDLLLQQLNGKLNRTAAAYLQERRAVSGRGKHDFLKSVSVLASNKEASIDLNYELERHHRNRTFPLELIEKSLSPLAKDFDVCLIDFPAGVAVSYVTQCGLAAADRWLFPVTPNPINIHDLDGPRRAIRLVRRKIKGLGTVLNQFRRAAQRTFASQRNRFKRPPTASTFLDYSAHRPKSATVTRQSSQWITPVSNRFVR